MLTAAEEVSHFTAGNEHLSLHKENPKPLSIVPCSVVNLIALTGGAANLTMTIIHATLTLDRRQFVNAPIAKVYEISVVPDI